MEDVRYEPKTLDQMRGRVKYSYVILEKADRPLTIGIDFDGTIVEVNDNSPVEECVVMERPGEPSPKEVLGRFREEGWKIIIDTCRSEASEISKFLTKNGIPFDYINFNPFHPPDCASTKIYCDMKLDDKSTAFRGWGRAWKDVHLQHDKNRRLREG